MKKEYKYVRKTVTWEGKRYEVKGKTEQEALEKLAALKASLRNGEVAVGGNSTVDRWFREWLEVYKKPSGITPKSLGLYTEKYNGYIKPAIGNMKLRAVREVHLQKILNEEEGRSFSHVSKLRMVMQEVFSKARKTRLIPYDPAEDLQLPDCVRGVRRSITDQERQAILSVADKHRGGLFFLTILYAGLRPNEAAALLWKDIDLENNEIHVYKALESGTASVKDPKTKAGFRSVPIHSALLPRLLEAKGEPFQRVFTTQAGNQLTDNARTRLWGSFRRALDIELGAETTPRGGILKSVVAEDLTPYCLRHTFCTDLQRAGVPINVAKELMGHANISVTANIYTHKDPSTLHDSIQKLSTWSAKTVENPVAKNPENTQKAM